MLQEAHGVRAPESVLPYLHQQVLVGCDPADDGEMVARERGVQDGGLSPRRFEPRTVSTDAATASVCRGHAPHHRAGAEEVPSHVVERCARMLEDVESVVGGIMWRPWTLRPPRRGP